MAKTSHSSHFPLIAGSALVVIAAGYLGYCTVDNIRLPTASDWAKRSSTVAARETLPARANIYDLAPVVAPITVPRVLVSSMPRELTTIEDTQQRKDAFIRTVLPLVLEVNALIERDRSRLLALKVQADSGRVLSRRDQDWLSRIMREYKVETLEWELLLRRVDTVPPSLAIAQAATESAWGTSRFAQEGNALFGQWTWDDQGMIPQERGADQTHSVRSFPTPLASVMAYARNLNTHPSYQRFRTLRDELRSADEDRPGYLLAGTLERYSERRDAYVEELRQIIRVNDLQRLNTAVLAGDRRRLALNRIE